MGALPCGSGRLSGTTLRLSASGFQALHVCALCKLLARLCCPCMLCGVTNVAVRRWGRKHASRSGTACVGRQQNVVHNKHFAGQTKRAAAAQLALRPRLNIVGPCSQHRACLYEGWLVGLRQQMFW